MGLVNDQNGIFRGGAERTMTGHVGTDMGVIRSNMGL